MTNYNISRLIQQLHNFLNSEQPFDFRREHRLYFIQNYEINDPTGDSLYQNLRSYGIDDNIATSLLNKPIIWETDNEGYITIEFEVERPKVMYEKYTPEQLSNLFTLLGAIYSHYDSEIDRDDLPSPFRQLPLGTKYYDIVNATGIRIVDTFIKSFAHGSYSLRLF